MSDAAAVPVAVLLVGDVGAELVAVDGCAVHLLEACGGEARRWIVVGGALGPSELPRVNMVSVRSVSIEVDLIARERSCGS